MKRITAELLEKNKACPEQVVLFRKTFPADAPLTMEAFEKAREAGLHVWWLEKLIPDAARAEYERVTDAAMAEYRRVTAPAWAEYQRVKAPALIRAISGGEK